MNLENEKYAEYYIEDQLWDDKIYSYNETEFAIGFVATCSNTFVPLDENEIEYSAFVWSSTIPGNYLRFGLHQCNETDLKYFSSRVVEDFSWG